ncbi:MAG: acyltransferase family protein, partial [Propionibacteriaceae bacterium]|nr:acyltransferase family protein [Propionibacteriaceae bacterium]
IAVLSVAVCPVIMAVTTPRTLLAQVLGWTPLRWLGERSYGIYLWHMPIAAFTPRLTQQLYPWQVGLGQVVLTVFLASVSWRFVEDPIRRGALSRPKPDAEGNVASRKPVVLRLTVGFVAIVVLAGVVMAGTMKLPQPSRQELAAANARPSSPSPRPRPSPSPEPTVPTPTIPLIALPEPGAFGQTACHTVVHLGDSTSRGLVSENYLPDPAQRMDAQYIKAGATSMIDGVGDAMAIVEHWNGEPSGFDRAQSIAASAPPDTCWVVALGLNDAATIAIGGSPFLADDRIDQIMSQVRPGERVMWVTTITQPWADPVYNNEYMAGWNASLIAAMDHYPNMRVYDWAADTATWDPAKVAEYFTDDGIHYTTPGCAMRAHMIARALATAFPAGQEPTKSPIISAGTLADNEAQVFPPPPPPPPEGSASPAASATSQG